VVELGIPELTTEQIETLCQKAENAARKAVLAKVSSKMIDKLDVSVEAEGSKPVNVTVEIELELTSEAKDINVDELVREATAKAHKAAEKNLRSLK
jgi:hypothetical protein